MSAQKNKTILAATLAIIGVFLLGGVSLTFFPSQTQPTLPETQINSLQISLPPTMYVVTGESSNLSSSHIYWPSNTGVYLVGSTGACYPPQNVIVIKEDGSVNSTAIQRYGDTYTLTCDIINQTISVERSNIVIDGGNHALKAEGIVVKNVQGVTVRAFNLSLSRQGVYLLNSTDIIVKNNNFTDVNAGVTIDSSSNCRIIDNKFFNCIAVSSVQTVGHNQLQSNQISKNTMLNGPTGVNLLNANSSTVTDNIIINTGDPIYAGVNATIAGNILDTGTEAIFLASQNQVHDNLISNFELGIFISGTDSSVYQNNIINCSIGVGVSGSSDAYPVENNTIWSNNIINNSNPLILYANAALSINNWDNGKTGNYWSSYNGSDGNGDGVGDIPYVLAANCTDNYPLMQPYTAASTDVELGTMFFAAAAVTALVGAAVIIGVYAKFRVLS